jgi:Flp pilus assembly protein TadB
MTAVTLFGVVSIAASSAACWFAVPTRSVMARGLRPTRARPPDSPGWLIKYRWQLAMLSGLGGATLASPPAAWVIGGGLSVGIWVVIGRTESAGVRHERVAAARDLVPLVGLFAAALQAGSPPGRALEVARLSLPGPAADRLAELARQLDLGGDPSGVWLTISKDPVLGALGRAVARAEQTGAPIALIVSRLADELAERARADVEGRARAVGVKAAVPLGLCLLPSFLLIGIVPVAAGLLDSLT